MSDLFDYHEEDNSKVKPVEGDEILDDIIGVDEDFDSVDSSDVDDSLREQLSKKTKQIATDQTHIDKKDVSILSDVCPGIGRLYSGVEVECSVCFVKVICKRLTHSFNSAKNKETPFDKLLKAIEIKYDAPMKSTCENVINYCFKKDDNEITITLDGDHFNTKVYYNGSTVEYPYELKPKHIKKIKSQVQV